MADFLPDEIIQNILARLPAKPLLRCRCVSKYWYRLLTEPNFMKLRSRRTIILPQPETFLQIDDKVPIDDAPNSVLQRRYPLENQRRLNILSRVIGTFNGIVVLAYSQTLILYNPFTGVYKRLPSAPRNRVHSHLYAYGFGYGATPEDLKIVRFKQQTDICHVYCFNNSSWNSWSTLKYNIKRIMFENPVGTFLDGFLYWITYNKNTLTVLNVKDMVLSEIHLYHKRWYETLVLGTIDGCLCSLNNNGSMTQFDMWVMKEHDIENPWSIRCSFNLNLEGTLNTCCYPLSILDSGRILMVMNTSRQPVIYDTSNDSYITLNVSLSAYYFSGQIQGLQYVESLFSPSDMCSSLRLKKLKRKKR